MLCRDHFFMSAILIFSILCLTLSSARLQVKAAIININDVVDAIEFSLTLFLYLPKIDSKISEENRTLSVLDNI